MINIDFMSSKALLPLQICIYFERIYVVIFFLFEIILYIFKSMYLIYPGGTLAPEIVGLFFLLILQYVKLNNANTANKTEIKAYHVYTLFYCYPVVVCYLYYLNYQIYILYFDLILSIIGMAFTGFEFIFSLWAIFTIKS